MKTSVPNLKPSQSGNWDTFQGVGRRNPTGKARDVFMYGSDKDQNKHLEDPKNYPKSL